MKSPIVVQCAVLSFAFFFAAAGSAQQKFPLKPGEWTMSTPDPTDPSHPVELNLCLTDATWASALSKSASCVVSNLKTTASGLSYSFACTGKQMQISGSGTWTYDGMEHIIAKATSTMTMGGKTMTSTSPGDYRWKASACSPNDMNLRNSSAPSH
jgi:Protein of unknown function (DUF3617)